MASVTREVVSSSVRGEHIGHDAKVGYGGEAGSLRARESSLEFAGFWASFSFLPVGCPGSGDSV